MYHRKIRNLPDDDLRQLRRAQRRCIEEWVAAVASLRPDLPDPQVRILVHAAIGSIQSVLFHNSGMRIDRVTELLCRTAHAYLGVESAAAVPSTKVDPSDTIDKAA